VQVANDSLREYLFAVVPLFVLMGLLVTVSRVGKDTFDVFEHLLKRVTAGLGIATVFANAVFASITGISIASATVFSRVAVPEMTRHGYTKKFATGVVAGSSVLGMLMPPSLLMIVYAVLAEESVGRMFLAGVGPGLLLAVAFSPDHRAACAHPPRLRLRAHRGQADFVGVTGSALRKAVPIVSLMLVVLGGLYGGFSIPTEAGAAGAAWRAGHRAAAQVARRPNLLEAAGGDRADHGLGPVPDPGGNLLQPYAGALGRAEREMAEFF
jgi:C4-dicarboxylate transporter DctM subunit